MGIEGYGIEKYSCITFDTLLLLLNMLQQKSQPLYV
jgi:hypothetical protein